MDIAGTLADTLSPSAKRAWIEMPTSRNPPQRRGVALCEEGVDRNIETVEAMDLMRVALCEEGVDRNGLGRGAGYGRAVSPSAKRAWIEIHQIFH